jgi:hypothetical protein
MPKKEKLLANNKKQIEWELSIATTGPGLIYHNGIKRVKISRQTYL